MEKQEPVKFYRKNQEFGFFSNFYPSVFEENGVKYPTNEHYFQSKKFAGKQYEMTVVEAKTPAECFKLGQTRQVPIRENWNEVKEQVMYQGLKLKFGQNADLKQKLLDTGNREIIEHTDKDHYWGDGLGKGKNRLGILLMQLRDEFRNQEQK